jgi:hypothetical protein
MNTDEWAKYFKEKYGEDPPPLPPPLPPESTTEPPGSTTEPSSSSRLYGRSEYQFFQDEVIRALTIFAPQYIGGTFGFNNNQYGYLFPTKFSIFYDTSNSFGIVKTANRQIPFSTLNNITEAIGQTLTDPSFSQTFSSTSKIYTNKTNESY